jgi:hypothetical protein
MEEVAGSNPVQCGFEYHQGHMKRIIVKASPKGIETLKKMREESKERMKKLLEKIEANKEYYMEIIKNAPIGQ